MVTVKCKECGREYDLKEGDTLSDYICVDCGGNLEYKRYLGRKPDGLKGSKGSKKPVKSIIISAIALIAIFAVLAVFTNIIPLGNLTTNNSTSNNNSTNYIPNETYAGHGITFNYPAGYKCIILTLPAGGVLVIRL